MSKVKIITIVSCLIMVVCSCFLLFAGAAQAQDTKKGAYIEIRIKDVNNNPVSGIAYEVYQGETLIDVMVSNDSGIATSMVLPLGNYTYKMVQCNNYFVFDNALYQVTLDKEEPNIIGISLMEASYAIILEVTDELGNPINGLKYTICKDDNTLNTWLATSDNQSPGLSGLRPGGYNIKLVSTPDWLNLELDYDYVVTLCNKDVVCKITYDTKGKNAEQNAIAQHTN